MPLLFLVRHGRTTANASGVLAGWTPGVLLDDVGQQQAEATAARLAAVPLAAVIASPLERTRQTAEVIADAQGSQRLKSPRGPRGPRGPQSSVARHIDERIGECRYGRWEGRSLKTLAKEPLWAAVQAHPSSVTFPGGESMLAMQHRAVQAVRDWNAQLGEHSCYAMVSHGDVIKAIIADALGMHLDQFQRITVDPCSVSVIRYTPMRPFVVRTNDVGGDLSSFVPKGSSTRRRKGASSDAAVGGGAGG
ncbi:MAG: MSMEG_4193 family putative phosphomutase [Actinomycetales bacterium]